MNAAFEAYLYRTLTSTLMKSLFYTLVFLSMGSVFAQSETPSKAQTITITVSNLDSNAGQVLVGLYADKSEFLKSAYKQQRASITNQGCEVVFEDVPTGVYAVSFVHDVNNNNKLDMNFLGIPKEDYGCSNNAKGFMGPPSWDDAKFEVGTTAVHLNIGQ